VTKEQRTQDTEIVFYKR